MSGGNPDNKGSIQYSLLEIKTIGKGGEGGGCLLRGKIQSILWREFSYFFFTNQSNYKSKSTFQVIATHL